MEYKKKRKKIKCNIKANRSNIKLSAMNINRNVTLEIFIIDRINYIGKIPKIFFKNIKITYKNL